MRFWKCESCENWDLLDCFCENDDFQNADFCSKWDIWKWFSNTVKRDFFACIGIVDETKVGISQNFGKVLSVPLGSSLTCPIDYSLFHGEVQKWAAPLGRPWNWQCCGLPRPRPPRPLRSDWRGPKWWPNCVFCNCCGGGASALPFSQIFLDFQPWTTKNPIMMDIKSRNLTLYSLHSGWK